MYKIKSEELCLNSDPDNSTGLKKFGKEKQDKICVIQWDDTNLCTCGGLGCIWPQSKLEPHNVL
jgi:hypothetical protein